MRIYIIKSKDNAEQYFNVQWSRHIVSLRKFNIVACSVFLENKPDANDCYRIVAIVKGKSEEQLSTSNDEFMQSNEFKQDMQDFPMQTIKNVETINLTRKEL
ncbi:hypothetical protein [Lactobacillus sp. B4005]|uniref:hypothetical protein n=1 Tax=Lactobacillus sp. B4005 TaxID=2818031 RepID=UPI0022698CAB|nr:hypothetical protein [Lactobacillus sp. B4005]MCX8723378.1 hypothetical protein [Lactobacillus sp. B4005]